MKAFQTMPVVNFSDIDFNKPIEEQSFNTPKEMPNIPDDEPIFSDEENSFFKNDFFSSKNLKEKDQIPLEKLDNNEDLNKKIFDYLTQMGKMFTKTIESSNWSEKVKKDNKNNFLKIEKNIKKIFKPDEVPRKKCDNSGCSCPDCGEKKGRRWNAKKFLITIPKTEAKKSDVLNYYLKEMHLKEAAIARETHKSGDKHLHLYLEFTAKKNIKSPSYFKLPEEFEKYGNTVANIQTLGKRTKEQVFGYLLKEDKNAFSYGFNIRKDVYGKLKQRDIWYKYAIGEWTIKDIVTYDPSYLVKADLEKLSGRIIANLGWLKRTYGEVQFY